ncbi:MAG: hypothetical protein U0325_09220 [Polyangiales bacterium]
MGELRQAVEFSEGVVLVDTVAHCASREDDAPGSLGRTCRDARPGGIVGLDASNGRELFRTCSIEQTSARWTVLRTSAPPLDARGHLDPARPRAPRRHARRTAGHVGTVLQAAAVGDDLLAVVDLRRTTAVQRRSPGMPRPRWERVAPWRDTARR